MGADRYNTLHQIHTTYSIPPLVDYGNSSPNEEDILYGPIFVQQPEDKVYEPPLNPNAVLDQAFLECVAEANPNPSYEWYKERAGERQQIDPTVDNR